MAVNVLLFKVVVALVSCLTVTATYYGEGIATYYKPPYTRKYIFILIYFLDSFVFLFILLRLSYPNFIWGPLFVGMRPSFDHLKMFNTHRCGIRKVLRYFGKKLVKNTNFIQGPFLLFMNILSAWHEIK